MFPRWKRGLVVLLPALAALSAALILAPGAPVAAAPGMESPGSLNVIVQPGEKLLSCPLEHTDVEGWITGDIAHVRVTQRFGNPYDHPIEAVYVFPLPENSAVNDMVMQIGSRTIRGVMKKREEAKQIYETAKAQGKTASLLEQERPNIFTQSVANIMPGDKIEITIWYVQDLRYDRGKYNFVFPMVVGPRYIPGNATGQQAGGWAPDTDQVPDASRITPPVLRPEERTGHDISLTLHLDAGVPAYDVACKSHEIQSVDTGDGTAAITLAPHDTLPNKDFDLSWRVAGERPEAGVLSYQDQRSGYFTLIVQPKANFEVAEIMPKEMVFCLDTSGSMSGLPIEKSKEVVKRCLAQMGPRDTFQVIRFSGDSGTFAPAPVPATPDNVEKAIAFINKLEGSGGTEMLGGIEASLAFPANPNQVRIVAFLTDGYVGNEPEILARIQRKLGTARIFAFGIGSSVNRYLLTKMGEMGRGTAQFVRFDENPDEAVQTFVERIARPYLTDLSIDWGGLEVADLCPSYVPDLFADQPMVLHGRYLQPGKGTVTIRGRAAGQPWQTAVEVDFTQPNPENEAIGVLWARTAIEDFTDQMHQSSDPALVQKVTDLAIAYRLMSPYTSFVAVEEKVVNQGGKQVTVQVPVPMPEGVSYEGVFGEADGILLGYMAPMGGPGGPAAGLAGPGTMNATSMPQQRRAHMERMRAKAGRHSGGANLSRPSLPADAPATYDRVAAAADALSGAWLGVVSAEPESEAGEAPENLLRAAKGVIALPAGEAVAAPREVLPSLGLAPGLRVLVLTGKKPLQLEAGTQAALAKYVEGGGFIVVDGSAEFCDSALELLARLLPKATRTALPADHALYTGKSVPYQLKAGSGGRGLVLDGRLVAYVSPTSLVPAWSKPETAKTRDSYHLGVNLIAYALQHPKAK